jgi:O-antigen ligase
MGLTKKGVFAALTALGMIIASLIIMVYAVNPEASVDLFFQALGRDPERNSMSIRINLWVSAWKSVLERPFLGYGFAQGEVSVVTWHGGVWAPEQPHNGYLSVLLQVGFIGFACLLCHLAINLYIAIKLALKSKSAGAVWALSYLTLLLLFNLTESIFLGQLTIPWTFYVTIILSVRIQIDSISVESFRKPKYIYEAANP